MLSVENDRSLDRGTLVMLSITNKPTFVKSAHSITNAVHFYSLVVCDFPLRDTERRKKGFAMPDENFTHGPSFCSLRR